jgi:hypothetical protein
MNKIKFGYLKNIAFFLAVLLAAFAPACKPPAPSDPTAGETPAAPLETELPGNPVTTGEKSEWAAAFAKLDNFTADYVITLTMPNYSAFTFRAANGNIYVADKQFLLDGQFLLGENDELSDFVYTDGSGAYVNGEAFGQQSAYYPFPDLDAAIPGDSLSGALLDALTSAAGLDASIFDGLSFRALLGSLMSVIDLETLLYVIDLPGIRNVDGWYTMVSPVDLKPYLETLEMVLPLLNASLPFSIPEALELKTLRFQIDGETRELTALEIGIATAVDVSTIVPLRPSSNVPVVIGVALSFGGYGTTEIEKPDWAVALAADSPEESDN